MQSEQQQRIMGYFIEEAKDHLNTIEQGLLSLQSTIEDTEMMNEVFRAAHSVKGGAGMLGISSIHKTAHRLEDYLKFLQESPVKVDSKLETLFLQVFDTLEGLVEQLQTPFGLSEETASGMMSDATPVFEQLNTHLEQLIRKTASAAVVGVSPKAEHNYEAARSQIVNVQPSGKNANVLPTTFKRDVLIQLREMLQIFKRQDLPEHRKQLQAHCHYLEGIGEGVDLPGWSELLSTSRQAIACEDNSYRQLAGLVIKEIKQAHELALFNRSVEITPSEQLKAMVPIPTLTDPDDLENFLTSDLNLDPIASNSQANGNVATAENNSDYAWDEIPDAVNKPNFSAEVTPSFYASGANHTTNATAPGAEMSDPEVGIAELNSLADIFEGQTPDLDQTWQEEEIINLNDQDSHNQNTDLLGDLDDFDISRTEISTGDNLIDGVGDSTNLDSSPSLQTPASRTNNALNLDSDFADLLFESNSQDQRIISTTEADELNNLFGDSFFEESDAANEPAFELDTPCSTTPAQPVALPLNVLSETDVQGFNITAHNDAGNRDDDLFGGLITNAGNSRDALTESALDNDWLELQTSDEIATPDELLFEELLDEGIEELTFDDADNLDLFSLEDLDSTAVRSSRTADAEESMDLFFADNDLNTLQRAGELSELDQEAFLGIDEQNTTAETAADLQDLPLFWEDEPQTDDSDNLDLDGLWSLADPIEETNETTGAGIEDLPGDVSLSDRSAALFNFDEVPQNTSQNLFEDEADDAGPANTDFDQNNFDDLFAFAAQPTDLDALTFEGIDLASLDGSEIEDLDVFNDFFDDEPAEVAAGESFSEFDEFSLFEEATTNNTQSEANLEQTEEASLADLSEFLFDNSETAPTDQGAVDDIDALLGASDEPDLFADTWTQEAAIHTPVSAVNLAPEAALDDLDAFLETTEPAFELTPLSAQETSADDDLFNWATEAPLSEANDADWLQETADSQWNLELEDDAAFAEQETAHQLAASPTSEFDDLETLLAQSNALVSESSQPKKSTAVPINIDSFNEFDDLEALLKESDLTATTALTDTSFEGFDDLEALLNPETAAPKALTGKSKSSSEVEAQSDFGDLEKLLKQADQTMGGAPTTAPAQGPSKRTRIFEQTMRVPVKHLDSLSNLVGELVVNRNSLEQDQERLRQFLDNLSHQVLALSDVGSRMQDLYERSLLESSLLASRHPYRIQSNFLSESNSNQQSGVEYDPLEMDRFTGFHLLSQEMIELIVRVRESASDIEFLVDETDQVARMLRQVTTQLQEGLTRSRMVPFAQTADRLPRAVRDISQKLRKEVQLYVEGRETLIDKMILEHLSDPMTHLINNALTHGIETPEIRRAAGKSATGKITLKAFHQGNQTVISVSDDGAGIDPERVRAKAIERRLISAQDANTLTNLDLYNFLFHPGFTTKDKEDEYAGRGVGMDVVLTSMSEIRGTVHIDSTLGKGTTFTIRLPLTLSICKALCCLSDRARIAFPMDGVEDMLDLPKDRIQLNAEGQTCIRWREALLPFQSLSQLLKYGRQLSRGTVYGGKREDDMISIVVLRSAGNFIAIQVDQVLGEQEIVIKQLEGPAPKPVGIAGATVLGDGRIMPIADVLELIDLAMGRIRKDNVSTLWSREEQDGLPEEPHIIKTEPMVLIVDDSITVRELLSMTFSKSGYRVEQARDGQEAWDKLRSGLPCDIVFCDIEMPRMDGLELLSRMQKDENLCNLPIAMLTSRGADRHRQMASQLGANGYFTKPYLEEVLLEAAQRMIKGEVLFGSHSTSNG